MTFSEEQRAQLRAPLDPSLVKVKPTPGSPKYIPGWMVMESANRIFGEENWGYVVNQCERVEAAPGGVLYSALVTVTVVGCQPKQDIGCEIASASKDGKAPSAQAQETAMKGAVTDGVKRALRSYGDQLGLQLYDKNANLGREYATWQREQAEEITPPVTGNGAAPSPTQAQRKRLTELLAHFPDAAEAMGDKTLPDHLLAGAIAKLEARFAADTEADNQEQLADALELARTAIDHVSKKRGGPTVDDASAMRDVLTELQRLDPRDDDRPAREVASKDLVAVIAKRLPASTTTPETVGVSGTLLPDDQPF